LVILDHVVGLGSEVEARALDDGNHVVGRLSLRHVGLEARPHQFDGLPTEARQTRVQHQRHQRDDCLVVRSAIKIHF
jgi:hypothetical protein